MTNGWHVEFLKDAKWEYKFSLWPRRCYISNRWLCLARHFKIRKIWGGIEPVVDIEWMHREEGLRVKMSMIEQV